MKTTLFFQKSRLRILSSLLFLCFLFSGFSLSSSKNEGRAFPLPGNFEEVWTATLQVLEAEKIPFAVVKKEEGYIQSATFPLYKKEYKRWAKAPAFSSQGFCALEIGIVEKDPTMTLLGIKAYFKRKRGFHFTGFGKRDSSRGIFEGLLAGRINDELVKKKFPKLKSIVLGCNLRYDEKAGRYIFTEINSEEIAYEQGLRNGDLLIKIDGKEITPGNLFEFFLNIEGEVTRTFTVQREKQTLELPVSIFYLNPNAPRLGMRVERDWKSGKYKVMTVHQGSPAEEAGFKAGDLLLRQNDFQLDTWVHYYRAILAEKEGVSQRFEVKRGDEILQKTVMPSLNLNFSESGAALLSPKGSGS